MDYLNISMQGTLVGFDNLQKADPVQLSKFIQSEQPQTIALVLAHLNSSQAAALLSSLPGSLRAEVVMRMANLEQISPDVISKITSILEQKMRSLGDFSRESYGGIRAVAELINRMETKSAAAILEKIEGDNPALALSIRNLMFVFDDVLLIDDQGMREILQRVDKKALTIALKGTSEELRNQFFRNMSSRAVEMMREDMDVLGPIKVREVETAQQQIVSVIRKLDESGVINLKGGSGDEYIN
jgi:flagellar motor switch protein FliG